MLVWCKRAVVTRGCDNDDDGDDHHYHHDYYYYVPEHAPQKNITAVGGHGGNNGHVRG